MSDTEKAVEKGDKAARKAKEAIPCGNNKAPLLKLLL
jgi:hypothetical protein